MVVELVHAAPLELAAGQDPVVGVIAALVLE
jgi:hypothetical protein